MIDLDDVQFDPTTIAEIYRNDLTDFASLDDRFHCLFVSSIQHAMIDPAFATVEPMQRKWSMTTQYSISLYATYHVKDALCHIRIGAVSSSACYAYVKITLV
jgi:hypothetical protein